MDKHIGQTTTDEQFPGAKPSEGKSRTAVNQKPIPLFYWSEREFSHKDKENYGDLLSKYLVEKISGRPIKFVNPKKQPWFKLNKRNYLAIGSIIHNSSRESIVWGSGIIDRKQHVVSADFRAVRGPRTRQYLLSLGYECPVIYGDPALLLPLYYHPPVEKKFKLGIIPHYQDFKEVEKSYRQNREIKVIDMMTLDVEEVTRQILECEKTISSSLHGIIVSHAYHIPSIWVEFSNKLFGDGVKFADYFESISLPAYQPDFVDRRFSTKEFIKLIEEFPALPKANKLKELQRNLISHSPF